MPHVLDQRIRVQAQATDWPPCELCGRDAKPLPQPAQENNMFKKTALSLWTALAC
jgi:hypothetical protein